MFLIFQILLINFLHGETCTTQPTKYIPAPSVSSSCEPAPSKYSDGKTPAVIYFPEVGSADTLMVTNFLGEDIREVYLQTMIGHHYNGSTTYKKTKYYVTNPLAPREGGYFLRFILASTIEGRKVVKDKVVNLYPGNTYFLPEAHFRFRRAQIAPDEQ